MNGSIKMLTWNAFILIDPKTLEFLPMSKESISSRHLVSEGTPEVFTSRRSAAATGRNWTQGQYSRVNNSDGSVRLIAVSTLDRPKLEVKLVILTSWYDS